MRVGLLGLGRIGAFHAATLAADPMVSELVVADEDAGRAEEVAARLAAGGARVAVGDAFQADAVVIATPTTTHADLLTRACEAGLPAFCEKPVASTLEETLQVRDTAAKAGTLVHIGFQRRFDPGYAAARAALHAGELGTLHRVHLITADPRPPAPGYIPLSGGIYRDCHIHDFDILRWVTGREVATVYATGANRGEAFFAAAGDVDTSAALLTLDDGTLVTVQGSRYNGAGYDVRMELAGTRRTQVVGLGPRAPLTSAEGLQPPGEPWPDFVTRFRAAYEAELAAFLRAVRGEGESPCSIEDALAALMVAEAAERSRREGRPVPVERPGE
ncbi:myo-inositol 2-dehydrogenase/D-chiro-inositol 1-dehydrogenase [Thermocatellispora tengchongensis]|uniref:Myo-inositol 2-dehydrogenase/D-chiro-inositol 1-dehydrogenase n=1 Tax=Thermocatellispora tengchongensis TaxID=1073253 RepID=A0A840P7Z3_9ACTN|nr:Gfo/Idh/MocA family oxidoreductase [Thermocatellispora tengchongensis]MBB5134043.1 myo-inositol 2-dehydrogenase/D-chiro-inositol 1-dehydrogenase [Thermocatellispora tengchongensis]